jgi:HEAT repeat protein
VPLLAALLRDCRDKKGPFAPRFLADRLGELGSLARVAKPELVELLVLSRKRIRTSAEPEWKATHHGVLIALERVLGEPGTAAGILRNEMDDPSWLVRLNALTELGRLGAGAAVALDSLAAALEDPQPSIRERAAKVLASLGTAASPALPALGRVRDSGDPNVDAAVDQAILRILHPGQESEDSEEYEVE